MTKTKVTRVTRVRVRKGSFNPGKVYRTRKRK